MPQIACKDLTIGYDSNVVAKNLNFEVNKGDYLCIVGENGAGKSTLMKTLLQLQKPIEGTITIGDGLTHRQIGYLPQQTIVQKDFPASVREIVLSGCQGKIGLKAFYTAKEKTMARENMERMGVLSMEKRSYRDLSGGQQQRVLLARALCAAGDILLLDEPVSGLDPKVTADMYSLIKKLNEDGITIIMISHDINSAVTYADHILHMTQPRFFGTLEDYLKSESYKRFCYREGQNNE